MIKDNLKYNLSDHRRLLKYRNRLKLEGKFLYDIDYDAGLTLTTYNALINQHFYWAKRFQIAWLIKLYLNGGIDVEKLLETF